MINLNISDNQQTDLTLQNLDQKQQKRENLSEKMSSQKWQDEYDDNMSLYEKVQRRYLILKGLQKRLSKDRSHTKKKNSRFTASPKTNGLINFREVLQNLQSFHSFYLRFKKDLEGIRFLKRIIFNELEKQKKDIHRKTTTTKGKSALVSQIIEEKTAGDHSKDVSNVSDWRVPLKYTWISILKRTLLFLGVLLFCYNIGWSLLEILAEKETLETFRGRFTQESEALYQLQRQKQILWEKVQRHKDLNLFQSFLNRRITINFSCITGVLFLTIGLFLRNKRIKDHKGHDSLLFGELESAIEHNMSLQEEEIQENQEGQENQDNQENLSIEQPKTIDKVFQEHSDKFIRIFQDQKDYILARKEQEEAKRIFFEQEKRILTEQLHELEYEKCHYQKLKLRKQNHLNLSLSHSNTIPKPQNNYSTRDENISLKIPCHSTNKTPRSFLIRKNHSLHVFNQLEFISEPLRSHQRSSVHRNSVLCNSNYSEAYKFCDRPY